MNESVEVKSKIAAHKDVKVAYFKTEIRKTQPHKHNSYFEMIYLSKGRGFHVIDNVSYDITPPVMYFVRREQVHYWEMTAKPQGYVVIIKKSFIEKSLDNALKAMFSQLSRLNCIKIEEVSSIESILELLTLENDVRSEENFTLTEGLLKALMAKILCLTKPSANLYISQTDLYHQFLGLLSSDVALKNKVSAYADLLNTSPQNLNVACRKHTSQSASEVLEEFIISEAKRLLIYTPVTVAEMTYTLGFSDPSHFIKYFKKATGQTPKQFRQSY